MHWIASSTSPLRKHGAMTASSAGFDSALRSVSGRVARKASDSSAQHVFSSAQWCEPKTRTRLKPIFHMSRVVKGRSNEKSHGGSSPSGTSSLGACRGVAWPSPLAIRAMEGSVVSVRIERGVRSEADCGRILAAWAGLRLSWNMSPDVITSNSRGAVSSTMHFGATRKPTTWACFLAPFDALREVLTATRNNFDVATHCSHRPFITAFAVALEKMGLMLVSIAAGTISPHGQQPANLLAGKGTGGTPFGALDSYSSRGGQLFVCL